MCIIQLENRLRAKVVDNLGYVYDTRPSSHSFHFTHHISWSCHRFYSNSIDKYG